jgi:hypothetical protein
MVCPVTSQTMRGGRYIALLNLSTRRGVGGQCPAPATLTLRKRCGTHSTRGYMGPESLTPCQGLNPGLSSALQVAIQTVILAAHIHNLAIVMLD